MINWHPLHENPGTGYRFVCVPRNGSIRYGLAVTIARREFNSVDSQWIKENGNHTYQPIAWVAEEDILCLTLLSLTLDDLKPRECYIVQTETEQKIPCLFTRVTSFGQVEMRRIDLQENIYLDPLRNYTYTPLEPPCF